MFQFVLSFGFCSKIFTNQIPDIDISAYRRARVLLVSRTLKFPWLNDSIFTVKDVYKYSFGDLLSFGTVLSNAVQYRIPESLNLDTTTRLIRVSL